MSKEIKVSINAESWISRYKNEENRVATLADINRIMCKVIIDQSEDVINDNVAFDMLLTLANLSTFIESLGE